jgi:hypothetical protein
MQTKSMFKQIPSLVASALLFTSCSGYQSSSGNDSSQGTFESAAEAWSKLTVAGEVSGGRFDKRPVFRLDKEKKEVVLSLPMAANAHIDGTEATLPLSKISGASLVIEPIEGGGSILTLHVPLAALLKNAKFSTPSKLPNGRPVPLAEGGELPAEVLALADLPMSATIYLGKNVAGLYVTLPLNPLSEVENPIQSADRAKVWGSLHTYPASCLKCKDGGLFTAVQIPADLARLIKENL